MLTFGGLAAHDPSAQDTGAAPVHTPVPLALQGCYKPDIKRPRSPLLREEQNELPRAQLSPDPCWRGSWALRLPCLSPLSSALLAVFLLSFIALIRVLLNSTAGTA